jgi:hypothetical protein
VSRASTNVVGGAPPRVLTYFIAVV